MMVVLGTLAIVGVCLTGISGAGLALAVALYLPRMFFVTGPVTSRYAR